MNSTSATFRASTFVHSHLCTHVYAYILRMGMILSYAKIMIVSIVLICFLWQSLLYGWITKHPDTQWLKTRTAFILFTNLKSEPGGYSSSLLHVVSAGEVQRLEAESSEGSLRGRLQKADCLSDLALKSSGVTSVRGYSSRRSWTPTHLQGEGRQTLPRDEKGQGCPSMCRVENITAAIF